MIKIIYFDERELLVRIEIETKTSKDFKAKDTKKYYPKTHVRFGGYEFPQIRNR